MLEELDCRRLFLGYRVAPPLDVEKFANLLADVSQWFAAASSVAELDLNPLIAASDSFIIVDVRMRVS